MRVEQLMTRQVTACGPADTLDRAAKLMWDSDCGCLPVCSGDGAARVVGVITDRDICMAALFTGRPLHELCVADTMTKQVKSCRARDSVAEAEKIMSEARIRRLPVVSDEGALLGVITLADLAREATRELKSAKQDVTETEVRDTLAAICRPTRQPLAA